MNSSMEKGLLPDILLKRENYEEKKPIHKLDLVIATPVGKATGVKTEASLGRALIGQYYTY
jgi:hypothetical protein